MFNRLRSVIFTVIGNLLVLHIAVSAEYVYSSGYSSPSFDSSSYGAPGVPSPPQSVGYKGLEWEKIAYNNSRTWEKAIIYCRKLKLGGHDDWRLPTKDELKSLVKCSNGKTTPLADWEGDLRGEEAQNTKVATCCIDYPLCNDFDRPTIIDLLSCAPTAYWSSTIDEHGRIWGVNFFDGRAVQGYYPAIPNQIRCVRSTSRE